jgi:FAD/FMN-containing dehydrogenase
VLALRVVCADGSVIVTGTRAKKSVAGYDLTRLMVGSEGTLGIITQAALRVYAQPSHRVAALLSFDSLTPLLRTVSALIDENMPLNMLELLEYVLFWLHFVSHHHHHFVCSRKMVECVNKKIKHIDLPLSELLYVEIGANDIEYLQRCVGSFLNRYCRL